MGAGSYIFTDPKDEPIFSEEYQVATETTSVTQKDTLPIPEESPDFQVEAEKYGIGKPKRIIIRAKIIYDQD
jgi:hypothetical protein